jgi:hypothetical protein
MFLICHNQELVWRGYEAVLREAERDRRFAAHVLQAARRVLVLKKRSPELRGLAREPIERTVTKLRDLVQEFSKTVAAPQIDDRLIRGTAERNA